MPFPLRIISLIALLAICPSSWATKRIPVLEKLTPNPALKPKIKTDCERLLGHEFYVPKSLTHEDGRQEYSKQQLLEFVDYLSVRRFWVSSGALSKESTTVKALLYERFGVALAGKNLYAHLREHFSSIEEAVAQTPEGRRLTSERDDANYKSWSRKILVRLALDLEKKKLPFEEAFLAANSSLVGMKLAEKYGYPVTGDKILTRAEKLGVRFSDIRAEAGLPPESIYQGRFDGLREVPWTGDLISKMLKHLQEHKIPLNQNGFNEHAEKITELILEEFGYRIVQGTLSGAIQQHFGSWRAAKESIGITYEGRRRAITGHPDWSAEFVLELLRFAHAEGYEMRQSFLRWSEKKQDLEQALKEKFGYEISGRSIYERAYEFFGTFEKACEAAGIPYMNHNYEQLPTEWEAWVPEFSEKNLNVVLYLEILQAIAAEGFEPTRVLLKDESRFRPLRLKIEERVGLDISGQDILKLGKQFFGSFEAALEAARLGTADVSAWPHETLVEAVAHVVERYPDIKATEIPREYSEQIGILLSEKMGLLTSGRSLYHQILIEEGRRYQAFNRLISEAKALRAWPYAGTPSKEFYLEVMRLIVSEGFYPARDEFVDGEKFRPIAEKIKQRYGYSISRRSIVENGRALFGSLKEVRKILGLPHRAVVAWPEEKTLEALKLIVEKYPDIKASMFLIGKSAEIGRLLEKRYKIKISGQTYYQHLLDQYGSLREAFRQIGIEPPWSRAYPPDREKLVEVLRFILSLGYNDVDQQLLRVPANYEPVSRAIETRFGHKIIGQSIYNYAFKLFGPNGLQKAVAEARKDP